MKTNTGERPIGYSAYCTVQQCFEYSENHCYVADSPDSLREFMEGCMALGERYRPVPVTMADILADYGVSGGAYCFEKEALQRFESTAREQGVPYVKTPFDEGLMNVDVRPKDHRDEGRARSGVTAFVDGPEGPRLFVPVTFSGHERPFAIHLLRCLNPQTVDGEMLLWFNEIPPENRPRFRGMSFLIDIDPGPWSEKSSPPRSDRIAAFVAEFLRDVTPEMRREFDRQQRSLTRLERELSRSTVPFPDHASGLLSYSDFLDRTGPVAYAFRFASGDCECLIEDFYCPNPDCDCNAVNLNFVACQAASEAVGFGESFVVHVPFATTDPIRITQTHGTGKREALAIATSWCADNQENLEFFRDRYAKIRDVSRRAVALAEEAAAWEEPDDGPATDPIRRKQAKVGRNDPCPCGSGKKYKKCCGKA